MEMAYREVDHQIIGMAGEFLVAGKLFKRGYQVSITLGNAKAVDLLVFNPRTGKNFNVQVKTQRAKNCFPIKKESMERDHIYAFVRLNAFEESEEFFIVPGYEILDDLNTFFGNSYRVPERPSPMPAINYGPLTPYKDNWQVFDQ
jgi:hypothetical protein